MRPLNRRVLPPGLPALRMVPLTFLPLARAMVSVSVAGPASVKRSLAPARARNVAGVSLTLRSPIPALLPGVLAVFAAPVAGGDGFWARLTSAGAQSGSEPPGAGRRSARPAQVQSAATPITWIPSVEP